MDYFMGIDVGTSSVKATIIGADGTMTALTKCDGYDIACPHGGWAEQHPDIWWRSCRQAVGRALAQFTGNPRDIRCVGLSGQMHTLVPLGEDCQVLRTSILHCDARSGKQAAWMAGKLGQDRIDQVVKNAIFPGLTLSSLVWLREVEPEVYARLRHILLPTGYLRLMLTGRMGIDHSDASATLAYDFDKGDWSREILSLLDVPLDLFPPISRSTDIAGVITAEAAAATGLAEGTPVAFGGADQAMQSVGSGCLVSGQATVNIGSGAQVCVQTDRSLSNPAAGVNSFCSYAADRWYLMGANSNGGSAFKWFADEILLETDYAALDAQTEAVRPGSDGLLFLPYLSGERCPLLNPDIRGVFWGLSLLTDRSRMARAVMEGIAFSLYDSLLACEHSGVSPQRLVALGGGTKSRVWLQMQADIFGKELVTILCKEQAVLGAAIVAGVGVGAFSSFAEGCARAVAYNEETFMPDWQAHETYAQFFKVYKDVYRLARPALEEVTLLGRREQ